MSALTKFHHTYSDGSSCTSCMYMPTMINPNYWERHSLTTDQIKSIVASVPSRYIWLMLCAKYGQFVGWSTIQVSYASLFEISIHMKILALNKLLELSTPRPTVAQIRLYKAHVPPIPFHHVHEGTFAQMMSHIIPDLVPLDGDVHAAPFVYAALGEKWLPVAIEGNGISCAKIADLDTYAPDTFRTAVGYTHTSPTIKYQGKLYTMTDEYIYVVPASN